MSVCVCLCVSVCVVGQQSFIHMFSIEFYKNPFKFPDKCFGFRLELVDEFTEIVPSSFRPFIGHHQGLFHKCKERFFNFFKFFFFLTAKTLLKLILLILGFFRFYT